VLVLALFVVLEFAVTDASEIEDEDDCQVSRLKA